MQRMRGHSNRRLPVQLARVDSCKRHLAYVHFSVFHTHRCILMFLQSLSMEVLLAKIGGKLFIDLFFIVIF